MAVAVAVVMVVEMLDPRLARRLVAEHLDN
jgi:hypothetical protein